MTNKETIIQKVEKLLTKAESTEFPEEAEALISKAQALMLEHQIHEAQLRLNGNQPEEKVTSKFFHVSNPYLKEKAGLWLTVAEANGCTLLYLRGNWDNNDGGVEVYGTPTDIEFVGQLGQSLTIQMASALEKFVATHQKPSYASTVGWKKSFLYGYKSSIRKRLEEVTQEGVEEVSSEVLPVLVSRKEKAEEFMENQYPNLTASTSEFTGSSSAFSRGAQAGQEASLGQTAVGGRGALGA